MDLILKGRGLRLTDPMRRTAELKLAKLERLEPKVQRLEVEILKEPTPRIDGGHRVRVAAETARHVFRAEGTGTDVDSALDQVIERLERQINTHRGKLQDRRQSGAMG